MKRDLHLGIRSRVSDGDRQLLMQGFPKCGPRAPGGSGGGCRGL